MTETVVHVAPPEAFTRADYVTGFIDLATRLASNTEIPLPGGSAGAIVPIHLTATTRGERLTELDWIAEVMGTQVTADDDGTLYARLCFGPVSLQASLSPEGSAHLVDRIGPHRAPVRAGAAA